MQFLVTNKKGEEKTVSCEFYEIGSTFTTFWDSLTCGEAAKYLIANDHVYSVERIGKSSVHFLATTEIEKEIADNGS